MAPSSRPRHAVNADDAAASQPLLSGSRDNATANYAGTTTTSDTSRLQTTTIGGSSGRTFNPTLGTLDAFAIVISIVIGSGIFTSPGAIDTNSPSPGAALLIWLVGGVLAWTGAATMAELGTAIPGEGGVQPYLKYCFGDVFGFLAAWTWIVAVMPATLAILSIVFVESIYTARGITDGAAEWTHKLLSVGVVVLVSVANCISTKASTRLNKFFVATKFLAIAAVVLAGLVVVILELVGKAPSEGDNSNRDWVERNWFATRPVVNPDGSVNDWQGLSTWEMMGFYSTALYGALWAYSGWDKVRSFLYMTSSMDEMRTNHMECTGCLHQRRALSAGQTAPARHQHGHPNHHCMLPRGECCILCPAAVGRRVHHGQCSGGESCFQRKLVCTHSRV